MPEDSPHRPRIEAIKKSGLKAAAIVQDLLALARRGVSDPRTISLADVVRDYMASLEFQKMAADHARVSFQATFHAGCDTVLGSAVHLSKAVMNLLTNAAEAMPDGGVCRIATDACAVDAAPAHFPSLPPGRYVTLTVSDNGIGIPDEDQTRIFEPFYSRKHVGRSGSGLGMAVIWHTIQDHGGHIHTDSRLGQGTTFTIYLPARMADTACEQPRAESEPPTCGTGQQVLIVDDEAEQRRIGVEVLNQLGYRVITATNGDSALAILERLEVDLVMLDMILEDGTDGLDVFTHIQRLRPGQRVILVSGFSESHRVQSAMTQGACAYLKKPYTMRQLGDTVQKALAEG